MPRSPFPPRSTLLLWLSLISILASCGGKEASQLTFPEQAVKTPDLSDAGFIEGVAVFEGTPPKRQKIRPGDGHCAGEFLSEDVIVNGDRLANVVVFVSRGLDGFVFPHVRTPAVLNQIGCRFVPHVLAVQTHQPVEIKNGDPTTHNVNTTQSRRGQGFNESMSQQGQVRVRQFPNVELSIPVTCEVHSWMLAYVHVFDHPHFAVTGEDGAFRIGKLPPGSYRISALHERFGRHDVDVTVTPGAVTRIDPSRLTFSP